MHALPTTPPLPQPQTPIVDPISARAVFSALQQQATAKSLALRAPPPLPTTCCGRGCNGCVWEGFYTAAACWQEDAIAAIANAPR